MNCSNCGSDLLYKFCVYCKDIQKCECGNIYTHGSACSSCNIFYSKVIELTNNRDIISSCDNFNINDMISSGRIFDEILYDLIINDDIDEAINKMNLHTKKINIIIKSLTGKSIKLSILERLNIIYPIMKMIQNCEGIPVNQQRIISGGHQYKYTNIYNFYNEMILHLVLQLRGD